MKICERCLNDAAQPFRVGFLGDVCLGCITHDERDDPNFDRSSQIFDMIRSKRSPTGYHAVVPVFGDADDYVTVKLCLDNGINPLILAINNYFYSDIGWHNLQNLIDFFDVDSVIMSPNFVYYQSLVKRSLVRKRDIYLPYQYLLHSYSLKLALEKKVKYIVMPINQPCEYTGNFSHFDEAKKSFWYHFNFDFQRTAIEDFLGSGSLQGLDDLESYCYPEHHKSSGVVGLYLSDYMNWDPGLQNVNVKQLGFVSEKQTRTFDPFQRVGSSVYYELHDLLRLKKHGYLKVRDQLNREVRFRRISRDNALRVYDEYLSKTWNLDTFYQWLDITKTGAQWLSEHVFGMKEQECHFTSIDTPREVWQAINWSSLNDMSSTSVKQFCMFEKELHI